MTRNMGKEDLSLEEHFAEVEELKKRLKVILEKYPHYDTYFSLLRWLDSYDYDIGKLRISTELSAYDGAFFFTLLGYNNFIFYFIFTF